MNIYYKTFDYNTQIEADGDLLDSALIDGKGKLGFKEVIFLSLDNNDLYRHGSKIWKLNFEEIAKLITPLPKKVNADSGLAITFHTQQTYCDANTKPTVNHTVFIPVLSKQLLQLAEESGCCEAAVGTIKENCPTSWAELLNYLEQHHAELF